MTVSTWGSHHLLDLLVGRRVRAGRKRIKPVPQNSDHKVNHLAGHIQQPQRVRLDFIGQMQWIAQGLLITACAHFKNPYWWRDRIPYKRLEKEAMSASKSSINSGSGVFSVPGSSTVSVTPKLVKSA